jgi:hypothetical protein
MKTIPTKTMAKITKLLLSLMFTTIFYCSALAQSSTTNTELEKKVEILEDILQKVLFDKESNSRNLFLLNSNKVETIISDKGIVMTLNQINSVSDIAVEGIRSISVNKNDTVSSITIDLKDEEKKLSGVANKESKKQKLEDLKPKIEDFFANYTLLLRELSDNATVTIVVKSNKSRYLYRVSSNSSIFNSTLASNGGDGDKELQASVRMKDVRALNQDRLNRDQFNNSITFDISLPKEIPTDVTIFNNILETLYSRDKTVDYFISEQVSFSDLGNIGYRFDFAFYSSYREGNAFRIVAKEDAFVSQKDKDQFVLDSYLIWKDNFINNLADYAITMRSLEKSKPVVFEIKMPSCPSFDEKMPDIVNISFSSSVLEEYRAGKLSMDKFKKAISIEEIENK